ncbi:MAG TPA: NHLP family bacteriocin export ABC transporter peptidase/permease/ATPase subunit [Terriglobales bacterium]|nr:NHLP family bacteriocin export ABC transporter peptidase/permease/ATPase subunit [Terriglobales bacterium]
MEPTSQPPQYREGRVRTPTVLQMEAVECGAASLAIILGYFGRIVPLAQLRQDCGVSRDGSKASNVVAAARRYGLNAKGYKKELSSLHELRYPYVVFWNFNHFLVVEGYKNGQFLLNDPETGPRSVSEQEFDESYTGVVLAMEPGPQFERGGRKPSVVEGLRTRLDGSRTSLLFCILAGFLLVLPGITVPALTQVFIDDVLIRRLQDWLRPIVLALLVAAALQFVLSLMQQRVLRRLRMKLSVAMSSRFLWHLLQLPVSYYAQRFSGEISSRLYLNDKVADALSGRLATTAVGLGMTVFYAAVMLQFDAVLTVIALALAVVNVMALQAIARRRKDTNLKLAHDLGMTHAVAISGLQGIRTLKASALENDFFARWSGHYAKTVNTSQRMALANHYLGLLPGFLAFLMTTLILVVGGYRVLGGTLTIGMLIAFQALTASFLLPVNNLMGFGAVMQELEGDLSRLDDVLENSKERATRLSVPWVASRHPVRLAGYVDVRNLTFGYNRAAPPLIEDLSFRLQPGQRVALIGSTGSGKSTISKLVAGLYEPWSGEILFDGEERSTLPRELLTNSIAMVEQDIVLFAGTVRENLTLWDASVPEEQIDQACWDAVIDEAIAFLPGGYNSQLLERAANMSGGQVQRLEIARALVNRPSILVMDEATSALDAETEKLVDRNIRRRGCTCIIVAHRLSTIRDCDEIIVLDRGKVTQRGTHEQLWAEEGHYRTLLASEGEALTEATPS